MMWNDLFAALALFLVFEGMLPFLNPNKWRFMMKTVSQQTDQALRMIGLGSMVFGVVLLYMIRG
ncbi:MAG: DUF2065 domain-containing protein [Gammaproteobacteria bacterium]